ncbi:hypothetical protein N9B82_01120 [Saprospiraceae bacterium]|nr:hypothetical protein [Saprospiraceae bacterium]
MESNAGKGMSERSCRAEHDNVLREGTPKAMGLSVISYHHTRFQATLILSPRNLKAMQLLTF